jgi:hypothetical protein
MHGFISQAHLHNSGMRELQNTSKIEVFSVLPLPKRSTKVRIIVHCTKKCCIAQKTVYM